MDPLAPAPTGVVPAPGNLDALAPAPQPTGNVAPQAPAADLGNPPAPQAPAAEQPQAPAAEQADNPNLLTFVVPGSEPETKIAIDLGKIPAEVRMDLLKQAARAYVTNSANQAVQRHKKAMEPWEAFEKASAADPLQTAVPKPTGDKPVLDVLTPAADARTRLYEGKVRKMGEGTGQKREKTDPLTKLVTDAVVRELFDKTKATNSSYKWTDAVKDVGSNGIKYLDDRIAAKVASAPENERAGLQAALNKARDERYINPAKMMLGQKDNKATKDVDLLG